MPAEISIVLPECRLKPQCEADRVLILIYKKFAETKIHSKIKLLINSVLSKKILSYYMIVLHSILNIKSGTE